MKDIEFKGRSLEAIREFGADARQMAGFELDRVQRGYEPTDWKPWQRLVWALKKYVLRLRMVHTA